MDLCAFQGGQQTYGIIFFPHSSTLQALGQLSGPVGEKITSFCCLLRISAVYWFQPLWALCTNMIEPFFWRPEARRLLWIKGRLQHDGLSYLFIHLNFFFFGDFRCGWVQREAGMSMPRVQMQKYMGQLRVQLWQWIVVHARAWHLHKWVPWDSIYLFNK